MYPAMEHAQLSCLVIPDVFSSSVSRMSAEFQSIPGHMSINLSITSFLKESLSGSEVELQFLKTTVFGGCFLSTY